MSSHGAIVSMGPPRSILSSSSIPTIVCIHVVPHFAGVEMITSSGRNANRSQRSLSTMKPRYRRTGFTLTDPQRPLRRSLTWRLAHVSEVHVQPLPFGPRFQRRSRPREEQAPVAGGVQLASNALGEAARSANTLGTIAEHDHTRHTTKHYEALHEQDEGSPDTG